MAPFYVGGSSPVNINGVTDEKTKTFGRIDMFRVHELWV